MVTSLTIEHTLSRELSYQNTFLLILADFHTSYHVKGNVFRSFIQHTYYKQVLSIAMIELYIVVEIKL